MKRTSLLIILTIFCVQAIFSQNYFQQEVNYKIKVKLDDENHTITAFETIEYINNSPDTLNFIYFHLWPNAYKNNKTELAKQKGNSMQNDLYFKYKEVGGYIDSLDFKIDNKQIQTEQYKKYIDVCKLVLNEPIMPGDTIIISTPFFVKLPGDVSRLGHVEQSYQISQWYPKPAVYDNQGWNPMPYLDMGEFYSEFGSFDVSITIPRQYVVGATGNLQTETEKLWLERLVREHVIGNNIPHPSETEYKTIRFTETNIHDFAWFANKDYYVEKSEVELPNSKRKVTTWAMYTKDNYSLWADATTYINDALYYYSLWLGDYPYDNCTAVKGDLSAGGGMEYPTITVISADGSALGLETVIMHEVGHNWFYGILGFNERDHPYLDEGINSFYEQRYIATKYPKDNSDSIPISVNRSKRSLSFSSDELIKTLSYHLTDYHGFSQPINSHSQDYSMVTYFTEVYTKTPAALFHLQEYLSIEKFDAIMQSFYEKWKYKHPQPEDLENHFKNNSDKNLDWFFQDMINTRKKTDYKIKYRNKKLIVKNKGKTASPFCITAYNDTNIVFSKWYDGSFDKQKIILPDVKHNRIILDPYSKTMDFDRYNNYTYTKGILRKRKPIGFRFGTINNFNRATLNILPTMGWNSYDKFMFGMLFHNYRLPQRKFQYYAMPMYSFGNKSFVGSAGISYKTYGYDGFANITYKLNYKRYSFIHSYPIHLERLKAEVNFKLNKIGNPDKYNKHLKVSVYFLNYDFFNSTEINNNTLILNYQYTMQKKSLLRPFDFKFNADISTRFYSFWAETNYKIHYFSINSGLDIRLFAGSNVLLSGMSGLQDYKFDYTLLGRTENFEENPDNIFAHQFVRNYGGFALYTPIENRLFLMSLNIRTSIPKVPIIRFYSNIAFYTDGNSYNQYRFMLNEFAYEVGIMLSIIPDRLEIYFPIYASKNIWDYNNSITEERFQKFRFVLNLNEFDKIINKFM